MPQTSKTPELDFSGISQIFYRKSAFLCNTCGFRRFHGIPKAMQRHTDQFVGDLVLQDIGKYTCPRCCEFLRNTLGPLKKADFL